MRVESMIGALVFAGIFASACSSGGGSGGVNAGDGGASGKVVATDGTGDGKPQGGRTDGGQSACPDVYDGTYPMVSLSLSSQCKGLRGPGTCRVEQTGCSVSLDCLHASATFSIDKDGVSDEQPVNTGDGVTANCHVEFGDLRMSLYCSAMGTTCEWGQDN
jgi:hypothetical protein